MKKFKLFSSAFVAALLMASCSADDVVNTTSESNTQYLTVSISNVGTRASQYDPTDANGKTYEDGTTEESGLAKVRFYFFDGNGNAYNLVNGVNYVDNTDFKSGKENHNETVENKTDATIVISSGTSTKAQQMVAVVNPESCSELGQTSLSLTQLKQIITKNAAWKTAEGSSTPANFLMSNSVYVDANGAVQFQTTDVADHMKESQDDAKNSPVDIYVERVAAKVRYNIAKNSITIGNETMYEVADNVEGVTNGKVYAKIEGWGIGDENIQANLVKSVDATWTNSALGFTDTTNPWNVATYKRCFWENNAARPSTAAATDGNHSWNDYKNNAEIKALYTLPHTLNTGDSDSKHTKVLLVATLYDAEGNKLSFGTFNGTNYASETSMKTAILAYINGNQYHKKTTTDNATTTTDITADDIKFDTQYTGAEDYQLVPVLASEDAKFYSGTGDNEKDATDDLKAALAKLTATWYTSGACYYQAEIQHLGSENSTAEYGVVRNHIYDLTISDFSGFGTPVYNPDETIVPTIPTVNKYYLAAKLNVLSWRVVSNSSVVLK